jgi:hypothetical protein
MILTSRHLATLLILPVAAALCPSSLGLAAGALRPTPPNVPSDSVDGTVILRGARVILTEGRVEVTDVTPVLVEGEITVHASDQQTDLADRFVDALSRPSRHTRPAKRALPTFLEPKAPRSWTCGAWENLWQGRGQGRSCEWR